MRSATLTPSMTASRAVPARDGPWLQFAPARAEELHRRKKCIGKRGGAVVERRAVENGSLLGERPSGNIPPESFGTGRVCIEPDCQVRLSRYNSTEWCALHECPASTQRTYDPRSDRRAPDAIRPAAAAAASARRRPEARGALDLSTWGCLDDGPPLRAGPPGHHMSHGRPRDRPELPP